MGEMADYYSEQELIERYLRQEEISSELKHKVERYSVSDEAIKNLIFETSNKDLCLLADKVFTTYYPIEKYDSFEINKVIDIAAWGISNKHLTEKQKWNLASFILFYSKGEM